MREDREAREIVRQARTPGAGSRLSAASGGAVSVGSTGREPRIDEGGNVRRFWLMGDPWTDDYFFGDWESVYEASATS